MIFCDTSLLLSLYVADEWSETSTALVRNAAQPLVWTAWHDLEISSALEARVGRGWTSRDEADLVYEAMAAHRESGFLRQVSPDSWAQVLATGAELAKNHGAEFLNRGMDVLHVALCHILEVDAFWSMDDRQRRLAGVLGLEVNPLADGR